MRQISLVDIRIQLMQEIFTDEERKLGQTKMLGKAISITGIIGL